MEEQYRLLGMSRSSYFYLLHRKAEEWDVQVLQAVLKVLRKHQLYGYRKVAKAVAEWGVYGKTGEAANASKRVKVDLSEETDVDFL